MNARLGLDTQVGMAAAFNERQDVVDGSACIANASPIEASRHEDGADQDMRQRQILDVKKVDALAEDLRLMVLLDAKAARAAARDAAQGLSEYLGSPWPA